MFRHPSSAGDQTAVVRGAAVPFVLAVSPANAALACAGPLLGGVGGAGSVPQPVVQPVVPLAGPAALIASARVLSTAAAASS